MSNNRRRQVPKGFIAKLGRRANPFAKVDFQSLARYQNEIKDEIGACTAEAARLQAILQLVNEALNDRRADALHQSTVRVTDHAILRYLERYEGMDLSRIERELIDMADKDRPEVAVRDGVIATVLPEGAQTLEHMTLKMQEQQT